MAFSVLKGISDTELQIPLALTPHRVPAFPNNPTGIRQTDQASLVQMVACTTVSSALDSTAWCPRATHAVLMMRVSQVNQSHQRKPSLVNPVCPVIWGRAVRVARVVKVVHLVLTERAVQVVLVVTAARVVMVAPVVQAGLVAKALMPSVAGRDCRHAM